MNTVKTENFYQITKADVGAATMWRAITVILTKQVVIGHEVQP
jgi:hypothetical protein